MRSIRTPQEVALSLIQAEFKDYHPLTALARLAHREEVRVDPKLELAVHATILPYVQPKLSQAEVKVDVSETRRVVISMFDENVEDARELPDGVTQRIPLVLENGLEVIPAD
jgi:hypothetical protein